MPHYGQLTDIDDGIEGSWFVELSSMAPRPDFVLIPVERLPEIVPVWRIDLPGLVEQWVDFTVSETHELAILMMRRRMAQLQGRDAGS